MFEPEDYLETIDNMIELNLGILEQVKDEEILEEVELDLARLRDLHHRIRLQFGIASVTWN